MPQGLTEWSGDIDSLITEMKRRAGVGTDTELANVLGTTQPNVSTWRKRGVPKKVLLAFERKNFNEIEASTGRAVVARAVAMRVAEYWYQRSHERGANSGRWLYYSSVSLAMPSIVLAVTENLVRIERETKRWAMEIAADLIEDENFLDQMADWLSSAPLADLAKPSAKLPE